MEVRFVASYRPPPARAGGFMPIRISSGQNYNQEMLIQVEVFYRRLLIAVPVVLVLGYATLTGALYGWLAQKPRNQITWLDLAAPWRWSQLDTLRGDTAILTGLDQVKARDYGNAFYNLRAGLSRAPGNVPGRLALAMLSTYEPARARAVMEEGIPACVHDERFLSGLMDLYASQGAGRQALAMIEKIRQTAGDRVTPGGQLILERARWSLLIQLARYDEAEAALPALRALDPAAATLREWELAVNRQRWPEARRRFEADFAEQLADPKVLRLAVDLAIGTGDADLLQRVVRRWKASAPDQVEPYLLALQAWHRMKRVTFQDAVEQEFYQVFARDELALQAFAARASSLNLPEALGRVRQVAVASRFSTFAFQVHQTELALRRREAGKAGQLLAEWKDGIETLPAAQRFYPEFIKRLTQAVATEEPEAVGVLINHLTSNRGPARLPVYLLAAQVLEAEGRVKNAVEILRAAAPMYAQADAWVDMEQRLTARLAPQTAAEPAQSMASSAAVEPVLPGTAEEALAQVDALLAKDAWIETRDKLRVLRNQPSAWLRPIEAGLAAREVEMAYLTLDPLASRGLVRVYLGRYRSERDVLALVSTVGRLQARERTAEAVLLKDEILENPLATEGVKQALAALRLPDDLSAEIENRTIALAALDRAMDGQDWAQVERRLKELRRKQPAWLAGEAVMLKVREVEMRLGLEQRLLALQGLKELIVKPGTSRSAAFQLVRDLQTRRQHEQARLLAREINRLLPDDGAAQKLLKETETPQVDG